MSTETNESNTTPSSNECPNKDKYESAIQLLNYEGQIAWQLNLLFIGLNIGIGTIISEQLSHFVKLNPLLIIMGIIGITINIFWLGTFRRNNKYYHFRMAQAREAEPQDWKLLRDRGYRFSKGETIEISEDGIKVDDRVHKLDSFEKFASNKRAIGAAIWLFITGFGVLLLVSFISLCRSGIFCF